MARTFVANPACCGKSSDERDLPGSSSVFSSSLRFRQAAFGFKFLSAEGNIYHTVNKFHSLHGGATVKKYSTT